MTRRLRVNVGRYADEAMEMPSPEEQIAALLVEAEDALGTDGVVRALHPVPGPYALFHHVVSARERLGDVSLIFDRMIANRRKLGSLFQLERRYKTLGSPGGSQHDRELRRVRRRETHLTRALRLDFESIYVFGAVYLDQWSIVAAHLAGLPDPDSMTFDQLANKLEPRAGLPYALQAVAVPFISEIRWLKLQFRTFRNRFVEHANRPWQRGTLADVVGMSFKLHLPSPPGWMNDEEVDAEIRSLLHLAPKWLQEAPDTYWERARPRALLERLVENVGAVDSQADRDRIAALIGRAGVTTPTFQVVVKRFAVFAKAATDVLVQAALERPEDIQVGLPRRASVD